MRDPAASPPPVHTSAPSDWVARHLELVEGGGEVLDVACGSGRHLALVLGSGRRAVGVDRDVAAAKALVAEQLTLIEADLESEPWPLDTRTFDGVIVTNYLWRPALPAILGAVGRSGVLIYETFGVGNERLGRPRRPEFLLRPGELIDIVQPHLTIVAYEHRRLDNPKRIVQRIAALGAGHPLARDLAS